MRTQNRGRTALLTVLVCLLLPSLASAQTKFLRVATASMGGAFYPLGNALAQLLGEQLLHT